MIKQQTHHRRGGKRDSRLLSRLCLLLLLVFLDCRALTADTNTDRRITVGAKLFSVLLGADLQAERKTDSQGNLPVRILYVDDVHAAEQAQDALQLAAIRGMAVSLSSQSLNDYLNDADPGFAVFIAQRLNDGELEAVVKKGAEKGDILFSPFAGDVERGVLAGISVQASVRPYINRQVLQHSGLDIKPFFLKVAKIHE